MKSFYSSILFLAALAMAPLSAATHKPDMSTKANTNTDTKQAQYHQAGKAPAVFNILKDHGDGTVDLGLADEVLVSRCVLGDVAVNGQATLLGAVAQSATTVKRESGPTYEEILGAHEESCKRILELEGYLKEERQKGEKLGTDLKKAGEEIATLKAANEGLEAAMAALKSSAGAGNAPEKDKGAGGGKAGKTA